MLRTVSLVTCLLMTMWQTAFSQGSVDTDLKLNSSAVKYSVYATAIPVAVGGVLAVAAAAGDPSDHPTTTLFGMGVAGLGVVIGPGIGHAYAGSWWHLAEGSAFRAVGAILLVSGIVGPDPSGFGSWNDPDLKDEGSDAAAIIIGSVILLWSGIHDFRTLDDAVERYNRRRAGRSAGVVIRPAYFSGERAVGMVASIVF